MQTDRAVNKFSEQVTGLFRDILSSSLRRRPGEFFHWLRVLRSQKKFARIRRKQERQGLQVPPLMIFSITSRCNLRCRGCYAMAQERNPREEMSDARLERLMKEAAALGTGIVMLAGGEPLMRPSVLQAAARQHRQLFPVFTNGMLLDTKMMKLFRKNRNLIPVLSMEGRAETTDDRRGKGVARVISGLSSALNESGIFYGLSLTLTGNNYNEVLDLDFIGDFVKRGCRLFFFVEYVPGCREDMSACLKAEQKADIPLKMAMLRNIFPSLFIALPGDEETYGGCLAAGRGFLHVSPQGGLEPCPFAPWSDVNVQETGLKEALHSGFLEILRKEHHLLTESAGGCTLWENRDWVARKLRQEDEVAV